MPRLRLRALQLHTNQVIVMAMLADENLTKRMYSALIALEVGQKVPEDIYIADYKNGEIPSWQVVEKEQPSPQNPGLYVLYVEDPGNAGKVDLFNPNGRAICKMVICTPRKILASPEYLPVEGRKYGPPQLLDLVQNARLHRKERKEKDATIR